MSSKQVVVVFGATGIQGGSLINSLLSDPQTASHFSIRGVTRDASKPSSVELSNKGVEVVTANLDDKESLRKAIQGAYAVFAVTNFWEKMDPALETTQGKNVADVANELGVKHFIWSSLLNITELTKGVFAHVAHFDSKAAVETHIRTSLPTLPSTFFLPGFYMSNLPSSLMPPTADSPAYSLNLPIPPDSACIPVIDTRADAGKFIKAILLNRDRLLGKRVYGAVKYASPKELVEGFEKVTRKKAVYNQIPPEVFSSFLPKHISQEMTENFLMLPKFGYYGGADLKESQEIVTEPLTSWEEFVAKEETWKNL